MDEQNLRRVLLVLGLVILLGSAIAAGFAMPVLQQAVSPIYNSLLCQSVNGSYAFAAPTSSEFCSRHSNALGKMDDAWCGFYPEAKAGTCRQLVDVLTDRWADCIAYRLTKETDFPQGAPQIAEYCRVLQAS